MPCHTIPFDPEKGPYIDVVLSKPLSGYRDEEVNASMYNVKMLIDTGASKTAISPEVLQKIGLVPIERVPLKSVTSDIKAYIYLADLTCDLFVPCFYMPNISILSFEREGGWHIDGFIGRDFLEKVTFEMNGPAKTFTITF